MNDEIVIDIVDWHDRQDVLMSIRQVVFVNEQQVPAELEWDGQDADCTHFLATVNAMPVATARLTPQGQIGRMAVLKNHRGKGIGSQLLTTVIERARQLGFNQVFLHAQVSVINFYQGHGFYAEGERFIEAGIEHQTMRLSF
ncbi:MAG: GNAT family N-acetyltransferase [Gammaproteobacteria bacterium]|jgi:predicted GNAT family N-acyltransferase